MRHQNKLRDNHRRIGHNVFLVQ